MQVTAAKPDLAGVLATAPGVVIEEAAKEHGVTPREVVEALPAEMRRFAPASAFIEVMKDIAVWGEVTLIVCPDRRIDRLCITCCAPSQPSHHADDRRDLVTPQARRVLCSARPWPSSPRPSWRACWRAQSRQPSSGAWPTMR